MSQCNTHRNPEQRYAIFFMSSSQQGDLRLSGSPSSRDTGCGARVQDRRVHADLQLPMSGQYAEEEQRQEKEKNILEEQSNTDFSILHNLNETRGVGGTVASESALRSAGTLLSRVRSPPPAPWPDGEPESLRSPCCGLAIYKTSTKQNKVKKGWPK
ncbi:hypothetical protein PoB_001801500 [Plakobranchus ocellatus]|uniref:Uncharacterized protein n=1 Tax=Plakobranchus ocellatus TaxID=259542 RepID=A0AAV3ZAD7_9GAST|nr:hypothetical protein PoB_001801500 [Plakobranchus ocellatus]